MSANSNIWLLSGFSLYLLFFLLGDGSHFPCSLYFKGFGYLDIVNIVLCRLYFVTFLWKMLIFFFFGLNRAFTWLYSDCKHYVSSSNLKLSWVLFSLAETSHMHTLFWAQLKIWAEFINRIWGSLHLPFSCPRFCLDFLGAVVAPNSGFLIFQTRKKKKSVNLLFWF